MLPLLPDESAYPQKRYRKKGFWKGWFLLRTEDVSLQFEEKSIFFHPQGRSQSVMNRVAPSSSERPRTTWTPSMDRFFIDLVLDHVRQGNMIDYAFRKQVWMEMNVLFNQKFGYQYEKDVLKNRYKSLRRKYNEITSILTNNGFFWDGTRRMIVAEDEVWDDYIKVHPDKRSYRAKVLPYYKDLCIIYGSTPYDGMYNNMIHDVGLKDNSSRTNSADASRADLHSPRVPDEDPVDDPHYSPQSCYDMAHKRIDEAMTSTLCEVVETEEEKKDDDGLFPVEVIFAIDVVPGMLPTGSGNSSEVSWTPSMNRYFIHLMLEHVLKGNKIGRSFNEEAWIHITSLFTEKFGSQYDKDVLINQFKTLRNEYTSIKLLLDSDGFHWNEKLQMVTADVHEWDTYIKANPDAQQYRVKTIPYFDDLCAIYGCTRMDGVFDRADHAGNFEDGIQIPGNCKMSQYLHYLSTPFAQRDPFSDKHEESPHSGGEMEICDHQYKHLLGAASTCQQSKKQRKGNDGMMDAIQKMANAVTLLADAKKENNNSTSSSIENVVDALQAVPDIDEDLLLDACDFLEDEKKAKTFLALDVRLRKKWLMRKLRPGV